MAVGESNFIVTLPQSEERLNVNNAWQPHNIYQNNE